MEQEAIMMIEVLAVMFVPSIIINAISWIFMVRYMEKKRNIMIDAVVSIMNFKLEVDEQSKKV